MSELKMLPNVDKLLNMDEASSLLGLRKVHFTRWSCVSKLPISSWEN